MEQAILRHESSREAKGVFSFVHFLVKGSKTNACN
jgi:hypothetical protein